MISERIHVGEGSVAIYDGGRYRSVDSHWFDADYYRDRGATLHSATGRGGVLLLEQHGETWVLRHYHRGGFVARFVYDHYVWTGLERNRAFREWRLLAQLQVLKLPAPRPIAARVVRLGPFYQADIVTSFIPGTRPLSSLLREGPMADDGWTAVGAMLRRFHEHGVDHPDLTAHNILVGADGRVFLVDFDNARLRPPGRWRQARVSRLKRSLRKVALETGTRFDERGWELVLGAYAS